MKRAALLAFLLLGLTAARGAQDPAVNADKMHDDIVLAARLYRTGDFEGAHKRYAALLPSCGKACAAVHAGLVRSLLELNKLDYAAAAAKQGLASLPGNATVRTAWGEVLFRQGLIAEADEEFVAGANADPPEPRAFLGKARINRATSRFKSAAAMITRAHVLDPEDADITLNWINTLPRTRRVERFKRLLESDLEKEKRQSITRYLELREKLDKEPKRCRLINKVETTETPLKPLMIDATHFHHAGLEMSINGRRATLLFDTGASGILLDRKIAEKAGLEVLGESEMSGLGDKGAVKTHLARAKSIKIGELEFADCIVEVGPDRDASDDGLIGADVFSRYLVTVDLPDFKLRLSPLPKHPDETQEVRFLSSEGSSDGNDEDPTKPPVFLDGYVAPEMQGFTRVFRVGSHLLVPTKINDGPVKLFLLDTGAFSTSFSRTTAQEVTKVSRTTDWRVKGVSGEVKDIYTANRAILQFGGIRQKVLDLVTLDLTKLSNSIGMETSGFLGFNTLRLLKMEIDYRDGLVNFTYDPGRVH